MEQTPLQVLESICGMLVMTFQNVGSFRFINCLDHY